MTELERLKEEIGHLKNALREQVVANGPVQMKVKITVTRDSFDARCGKCGRILRHRKICLRCFPLHACPVCQKKIGPRASFCSDHSPHNEAVLIYKLNRLQKDGKEGTAEWAVAQYELDSFRALLPRTDSGERSFQRQESAERLRNQQDSSKFQKTSGEPSPTSESTTLTG